MNNQLYRLIYCSRNLIGGAAPDVEREVHNILLKARANNAAGGISGALLYNSGNFAQVLEGPVASVGRVFEKIQRDLRHTEVTVIENGRASERQFPDWSMAFVGESTSPATPVTAAAFNAAFGQAAGAGEQILDILRHLVAQEESPILLSA